ncbi:probable cyclin-dependent serine/threonine-protein kinase DDB_G0292550 [Diaphorina citri]|uniref:Probable cyclin-dependent serine/threonine-protein kinase DDB_G0292550 n=1 Tax=Diaphorina citri TaxID=121845 RepID=A0A1S4ERW8_DIACI|nr:probable cyclin-dependent serine/threonine-protein kinase DDB_G0292550 [Diaphorina citri]
MENHKENLESGANHRSDQQMIKNHVNSYRRETNGEDNLKRSRDNSRPREHGEVLDNDLASKTDQYVGGDKSLTNSFEPIIEGSQERKATKEKLMNSSFEQIIEKNSTALNRDTQNNIGLVNNYHNLTPELDSPDSDDLFDSHKVPSRRFNSHARSIENNNANCNTPENDVETVTELSNNNSDSTNISANVIETNTPVHMTEPSELNLNNNPTNHSVTQNDLNREKKDRQEKDLSTKVSDLLEKVSSLNANLNPKVVFHTPQTTPLQTTPLKLKLNSLPVQSHPLEQHALDRTDQEYCNEPLDFPNSPVLNKSIDDICLKRYKRSCQGATSGPNPLCVQGSETPNGSQETEMNCIRSNASASPIRTLSPSTTIRTNPSASTSFESVTLARSSLNASDFTNNISAESYLKKYDDINAQVRAYLNKTQSQDLHKTLQSAAEANGATSVRQSELEALNERSHRYLSTNAEDDISSALGASKVMYVSDDEDVSVYDTIVSQDCHGVKLVKNARKSVATSDSHSGAQGNHQSRKKLLLSTDLFSGNLMEDDLASLSDEDLDELLTPSNADDDLENSILEQLNLSDDDLEIQELSAKEEREEGRRWKICVVSGVEKRIDMKVIEPYKRVLSHGGYLAEGCHNAIIVFSACFLPHHSRSPVNPLHLLRATGLESKVRPEDMHRAN